MSVITGYLRQDDRCGCRLRVPLRLNDGAHSVQCSLVLPVRKNINVTVHRFHEDIGGRPYEIEVTPVSNQWRAQLRRTAGVPTAMMPFYGKTPEDAARGLTKWLTLAHRRQNPAGAA